MNKAQSYLETLTVSDSSLEKLIEVARSSGADGQNLQVAVEVDVLSL